MEEERNFPTMIIPEGTKNSQGLQFMNNVNQHIIDALFAYKNVFVEGQIIYNIGK